jgi:hypothetical protein
MTEQDTPVRWDRREGRSTVEFIGRCPYCELIVAERYSRYTVLVAGYRQQADGTWRRTAGRRERDGRRARADRQIGTPGIEPHEPETPAGLPLVRWLTVRVAPKAWGDPTWELCPVVNGGAAIICSGRGRKPCGARLQIPPRGAEADSPSIPDAGTIV